MRRAVVAGIIGVAGTGASCAIIALAGESIGGFGGSGPSSLVQRPFIGPPEPHSPSNKKSQPARFPFEFRTIDGVGNNGLNPTWGAAGVPFIRLAPASYEDGSGTIPAGADRPSPRHVSNALCSQHESILNERGASAFLWQWGQFLDHDIDETPIADPREHFDIEVPQGDPQFDPKGTGGVTIPLDRSAHTANKKGVRQHLNNITAFIDGSNVYGSDDARAAELRTLDGTGRLKTSPGDLLPFNTNGFPNAPTSRDPSLFLAGDIRANEQVALTAMHTLFVREHNYWADTIAAANPEFTGDEIYEHARAMVGAEMQAITYNEFLPMLLGPNALPTYTGYRKKVNPGVLNEFATAAYRVGHTLLSSPLMRMDENNEEIPAGHLPLAGAFFNQQAILDDGIDCLLRGLCAQPSQEIDSFILDDVRNFLFGPPGAGGFDLAALNIQRGRDHGLPTYNGIRIAVGRPAAKSFADVNPDPQMQKKLAAAYDDVDQIDAWVGLLAEPHRPGAMVGDTLFLVLRNQFTRLRDGDRFWYQAYLPPHLVDAVDARTLGAIIHANTGVGDEMPVDVFSVPVECFADLDGSGAVDEIDLQLLLKAWGPCADCPEDLTGDGMVDVADVEAMIAVWGPCP